MLRMSIAMAVVSLVASVWAGSLPQELVRALKQREQFYYNRRIVFHIEEKGQVHNRLRQARYALEILRAPSAILVRQQPLNGVEMSTEQSNSIQFDLQNGWTSACYIDEKVITATEPSLAFSSTTQSIERATMTANLRRGGKNQLYGGELQWDSRCQKVCGMYGVFTLGLDVSKLYHARWERVEERSDRWVLRGKARAREFELLPSDDYPDIVLRAELRRPDALPLRLEVIVPFRRPNMWLRHVFHTARTKRVDKFEVPDVIEYRLDDAEKRSNLRVVYDQVLFDPLQESIQLDLPQGTTVADERLGRLLNYKWTGRLPTEEELKQLAYQQGNLIPPETPHRRFSPLLFVPAILFFALAAYLYFKNRRR